MHYGKDGASFCEEKRKEAEALVQLILPLVHVGEELRVVTRMPTPGATPMKLPEQTVNRRQNFEACK